jgi:hypothetical protein
MNSIRDPEAIDSAVDEISEEAFPADDRIGLTFANGRHETDLLSFLEHAKRMAGEVC